MKWSSKEEEILQKYYIVGGAEECAKYINRTKNSIRTKAYQLNIKRDFSKPKKLEDSLLYKFPNIAKDWSDENSLSPKDVYPASHLKVQWNCRLCNKKYISKIANRVYLNNSCPECGHKQGGLNLAKPQKGKSLLDLRPDLAKEWSEKNQTGPENYKVGSKYKVWWKCQDCSFEYESTVHNRTYGRQCNCPLCKSSKGEKTIQKYLVENNIKYTREYRINECKNIKPLPFDFAIFDDNKNLLGLIEYNGRQHYNICQGYFTSSNYYKIVERDKIKETYCKNNSISLLIIPYTEINNINIILKKWINNL